LLRDGVEPSVVYRMVAPLTVSALLSTSENGAE